MRFALAAITLMIASPAGASGTLYYGSRAGMVVDVVSVSGLSTTNAVIKTKHTRQNAASFCREYMHTSARDCIEGELGAPINDILTANCKTGEFVDFSGRKFRFAGPSHNKDDMARYRIVDVESGEDADGSTASGYSTNVGIFKALCPAQAPADILD